MCVTDVGPLWVACTLRLLACLPFAVGCWAFRRAVALEVVASRIEGRPLSVA